MSQLDTDLCLPEVLRTEIICDSIEESTSCLHVLAMVRRGFQTWLQNALHQCARRLVAHDPALRADHLRRSIRQTTQSLTQLNNAYALRKAFLHAQNISSDMSRSTYRKKKSCAICSYVWYDKYGKDECPKCLHPLSKPKRREPGEVSTFKEPPSSAMESESGHCPAGELHLWRFGRCVKCGLGEGDATRPLYGECWVGGKRLYRLGAGSKDEQPDAQLHPQGKLSQYSQLIEPTSPPTSFRSSIEQHWWRSATVAPPTASTRLTSVQASPLSSRESHTASTARLSTGRLQPRRPTTAPRKRCLTAPTPAVDCHWLKNPHYARPLLLTAKINPTVRAWRANIPLSRLSYSSLTQLRFLLHLR